jgi:hypothetical protein
MEKLDELKVIKEYLLTEIDNLRKAQNDETEKAFNGKVSGYVINIINAKFEDRKNHLKHLLDENLAKIKELKDKNSIV